MGERYGMLVWVLKDGISRVERTVEAQKLGYAVLALGDGQLGPGDLELTVWVVGRLLPSQRPLGERDVELEELYGGEAELYSGKGGSEW